MAVSSAGGLNAIGAIAPPDTLVLNSPPPLTQHPAAVYLTQLGFGSRRTMRQALDTI